MSDTERTIRIKLDGTARGLDAAARKAERDIKEVDRAEAMAYAEAARREKQAERDAEARARAEAAAYAEEERRAKAHEAELIRQGKLEEAAYAEDVRRTRAKQQEFERAERERVKAAEKARAELERISRAEQSERDKALRAFESEMDRRSSKLEKLRTKFLSVARGLAAGFAGKALQLGGLNSVIGTLTSIVGWAGAASGALGLIPGAIAVGAAGMITWKLGADGVKKAFEGSESTLDRLKEKVSSTFRSALAPAVRDVNALLPRTTSHFQNVAAAISSTITRITAMARERSNLNSLNAILDNGADIIRNIGKAAAPVIQAFLDIASVGSAMLTDLTEGAGDVAQRFADWIRGLKDSGRLWDWMQTGLDTLRDLGDVLGDVWDIAKSVFGALREGGAGVAPVLSPAIKAVKDFVESPQGQETFRTLGEVLSKVGDALSRVLQPALRAVGPLIEPLGTLLGTVADILADSLGPAFEDLGHILEPVVRALSPVVEQLVRGLAPIIPILVRALAPFAAVLIMLAPVVMLLNIPLIAAVTLLTALAQLMMGDVVGAGKTMAAGMQQTTDTMRTITQTNWAGMAGDALSAMSGMGEGVATKAGAMRTDFGSALMGMQGDTTSSMSGIGGALSTGMGQAVGIAGMGGASASNQFGSAIMGMPDGANRGSFGVLDILRGMVRRIPEAMANAGSLLFESGKAIIVGLGRGIDAAFGGVFSKVGNLLGRLRGLFPFSPAKYGPFSGRGWVLYSGMSIAEQFGEGVLARTGNAVAAMRALTGRVAAEVPSDLLAPVPSAASTAAAAGASAARASAAGTSTPQVIELTVDLGKGMSERIQVEIDESGRATARAAGAGTGGMR
ncbi:hypothetical protein [Amycolatopsis solani]|uniref:hypothetical protein n=1 Tax=Amycolatopsis solani TaxID=3028615 RepID=UPI0025B16132|nr:hypothetical protein [Amycolatopsis sp. MEP2-6]